MLLGFLWQCFFFPCSNLPENMLSTVKHKQTKQNKNNWHINPWTYKGWGGGGWGWMKVFLSFLLEDHLMFSVAVRSSLARILSQVQWWSVSMVTKYYVIRRRWWSHFEWKLMFFQLFSPKKVNLVAKTMQSAQLHILCYFSSQPQKITISCGFNLISNTW